MGKRNFMPFHGFLTEKVFVDIFGFSEHRATKMAMETHVSGFKMLTKMAAKVTKITFRAPEAKI